MANDPEGAPLSSVEIQSLLHTGTLGRFVHVFDEVDSTNRSALSLAATGSPNGTIVVAEAQSGGRGRLGRKWHSPPRENLYCSILLRASPTAEHLTPWLSWVPLVTGLGVLRTVSEQTGLEAKLKWPNDVLIGAKKVAGILCESMGSGSAICSIVVGIGININAPREQFPTEIVEHATSLASEAGRRFCRTELLAALLNDLEPRYESIAWTIPESVILEYATVCSTLGRKVRITLASGEILDGHVQGLEPDGALSVVQVGTGRPWLVHAGDVTHVR